MIQFTPLVQFSDVDLQSLYIPGLSYSVKDYIDPMTGNVVLAEDSLLAKKVPEWIAAGKIRLGAPTEADAQALVTGNGEVQ